MMKKASYSLVLSSVFLLSTARPLANFCPPGHITYGILCCIPLEEPDICGQNHKIKRCEQNGEHDKCVPCENGTFNYENKTSWSASGSECYPYTNSCPEESVPSNKLSSCGYCKCDESRGYTGDPCNCNKVGECGNNTYLKNGHCVACPAGMSREGLGYGPCTKITTPTTISSQTTNTQGTMMQSTTAAPTTTSSPDIKIIEKNTTNDDVQDSVQTVRSTASETRQIVIIVLVAVALVAVALVAAVVLFIKIFKKRQGNRTDSQPAEDAQSSHHLIAGEQLPNTCHHDAQGAPPPYNECPPSYNGHSFAGMSHADGDLQVNASRRAMHVETQGAVPFQGNHINEDQSSVEYPSWSPLNSAESGPSTSGGLDDADNTHPKVALISQGQTIQAGPSTSQVTGSKGKSSVIPVKDESLENETLLHSAPTLDPQSFEKSSG